MPKIETKYNIGDRVYVTNVFRDIVFEKEILDITIRINSENTEIVYKVGEFGDIGYVYRFEHEVYKSKEEFEKNKNYGK